MHQYALRQWRRWGVLLATTSLLLTACDDGKGNKKEKETKAVDRNRDVTAEGEDAEKEIETETEESTSQGKKPAKPKPSRPQGDGPGSEVGDGGGQPPGGDGMMGPGKRPGKPDITFADAELQQTFDSVFAALDEIDSRIQALCPDAAERESCAEQNATALAEWEGLAKGLGKACIGPPPTSGTMGSEGASPSMEQLATLKAQMEKTLGSTACSTALAKANEKLEG